MKKRSIKVLMIFVFLFTSIITNPLSGYAASMSISDGGLLYAPSILASDNVVIENQKTNIKIREGYIYFTFKCAIKNDASVIENIAFVLPYLHEEGLKADIDGLSAFMKLFKRSTLISMYPKISLPNDKVYNVYRGKIEAGAKKEFTLTYKQKYLLDKKLKIYIPKDTNKAVYLGDYKVTLDSGILNLADYSSIKNTGDTVSETSILTGTAVLSGKDIRQKVTISYKNTGDEITSSLYKGSLAARNIADAIQKKDYKTVESLTGKYLVLSSTNDSELIRNMIWFASIEASYKNKDYSLFIDRVKDFNYLKLGSPQLASRMLIMQLDSLKKSGLSENEIKTTGDKIINKFEKSLPEEYLRIKPLLIRNGLIPTNEVKVTDKNKPIVTDVNKEVIDKTKPLNQDKSSFNLNQFLSKEILGVSIGTYFACFVIFIIGFVLGIIFSRRKGKKNKNGKRTIYI